MKKSNRGGGSQPVKGKKLGEQNAKPVKTGTANFERTAKKVHPKNREMLPMRGGIRL